MTTRLLDDVSTGVSRFLLVQSLINTVVGLLVALGLWAIGVPYPVLARASFGVWGANLPALVRAVVACFWYGAQTAAASGAMVALLVRHEGILEFHKNVHFLGHSGLEVICYVMIWALQLLIIQRGMETVRKFQDWAGPAVWVARPGGVEFPDQLGVRPPVEIFRRVEGGKSLHAES